MTEAGHNNPPGTIEFSKETVQALSDWMRDHPVISSEDEAREAKLLVDRATLCSKDMADERSQRTAPLRKQVDDIRGEYKEPEAVLGKVLTELQARLNAYLIKLERERQAAAEKARREAEEAERAAREAEALEQAAIADAKEGVLDVDIAAATQAADQAFSRFKEANKEAAKAIRDADHVKIGGGFRRAASLRTKETLVVEDWRAAIKCMGLTDAIRDAVLTEARAFRKTLGELPDGVTSIKSRG